MRLFFEMSFDDYCEAQGVEPGLAAEHDPRACARREAALQAWRAEANARFAAIKACSHFHNWEPCADVHGPHRREQAPEA